MKVKALKGFTAFVGEDFFSISEGQVLEMPAGADWVRAGLTELLEGEMPEPMSAAALKKAVAAETAAFKPADAAVPAVPRKRKPK